MLGLETSIKPKAAIARERAIAAFGSDSAKWSTDLVKFSGSYVKKAEPKHYLFNLDINNC